MKRLFQLIVISVAVVTINPANSLASVPLRHILLSTNDLNDMGQPPLEGEILYDLVTGSMVAHLNGVGVFLPTPTRLTEAPLSSSITSSNIEPRLPMAEMRVVLLAESAIVTPQEGELAHDTVNHRLVVSRGGVWRPLGHKAPSFMAESRSPMAGLFRHILPDISTITLQEGELAADFSQNTVWFKSNGVQVDLRVRLTRSLFAFPELLAPLIGGYQ